jgi:hypothetical protein
MNTQVTLSSFHDIKRVHTFRCPLCNKELGKGRIGILVREGAEVSGLVGLLSKCCNQEIGIPEVFDTLQQADLTLAGYLRALDELQEARKDNPNATPPFVIVPASQMGLTPERLRNSLPSSGTAQGN